MKKIISWILSLFTTKSSIKEDIAETVIEQPKEEEMVTNSVDYKLKIIVKRFLKTETSTIGKLYLCYPNGKTEYLCDTLEDKVRNPIGTTINNFLKINAKTAIPYGTYTVVLSYSNRFKKIMPELLNVPHYTGVRIHSGNTHEDTEGCLLTGTYNSSKPDYVSNSRVAYNKLMSIIEPISKKGKIVIEIS